LVNQLNGPKELGWLVLKDVPFDPFGPIFFSKLAEDFGGIFDPTIFSTGNAMRILVIVSLVRLARTHFVGKV